MREKSFIALGRKLRGHEGLCNRGDRSRLIFFEELNTSQAGGLFRAFAPKRLATISLRLTLPDRGEPVGAGWLMNIIDFVAKARGLESDLADGVKKPAGCGGLPRRSKENVRTPGNVVAWKADARR
jgi:hypothetical protein